MSRFLSFLIPCISSIISSFLVNAGAKSVVSTTEKPILRDFILNYLKSPYTISIGLNSSIILAFAANN